MADVEAPSRGDEEVASLDVKRSTVVGGKEVGTCDWPSTVRVLGSSQCTGTLIHPRVVTTAAHCLGGTSARVAFGGPRDATAFTVTARCRAGARGSSGVSGGSDWAYCVLPEDPRIAALPVTPPLVGCEAERFLKPGARAWVVGYGTTGPRGQGAGIKREVEVEINSVDQPRGTINVGDATVGACHGDSGGPLYLHLIDAQGNDFGYRVIGSTSGPGARNCDCTCSTSYVNIATHVADLERSEGIDVTPCTDASGAWAPGPSCRALPAARTRASGSFPACTVPRTSSPIETCGPNDGSVAVDAGAGSADGGGDDASVTQDAGAPDARDGGRARADGAVDAGVAPTEDGQRGDDEAEGEEPSGGADEDEDESSGEAPSEDEEEETPSEDEEEPDRDRESEEKYEGERDPARTRERGGCSLASASAGDHASWLLLLAALAARVRRRRRVRRAGSFPA